MFRDANIDDLFRSLAIAKQDEEYQREVASTEAGRRSAALRQQAAALEAAGQFEEVHALLLEAARLHPDEDKGAAAASVRHDLGHSYMNRRLGVRLENLLAAERCLRASLACPPRAARLLGAAQTKNSLGLCLRHLAMECFDEEKAEQLLDEAEELLRQASAAAEAFGPVGWGFAADYSGNLGNLLLQQREDVDGALAAYRRALDFRKRAIWPGYDQQTGYNRLPLAAAAAYCARRRKGDAQRAIKLAEEVVRDGHPRHIHAARLCLAECWLATHDGRREEKALEQLRALDVSALGDQSLRATVALFRRLRKQDEALGLLHRLIDQAIARRSLSRTEHGADDQARAAQAAAALAARLHADKGDAVQAFLVLENSSGLRFIEACSDFTWRPADPVTRLLFEEWRRRKTDAATMAGIASMLGYGLPAEQRAVLAAALEDAQGQAPTEVHLGDAARKIMDIFARVASDPDPASRLRQEVEDQVPAVDRAFATLAPREPDYSSALNALDRVLRRRHLEALSKEHAGSVLLRLSLADDLLVVAIWHDGHKLVARSQRIRMPKALWSGLARIRARERDVDRRDVTRMLEALDLSAVLPEARMERAVVLPSYAAAFLPLAALGPPGRRLLDRFESTIWLPSLFPLWTRQDAHPPRNGTLTVTPDGTHCPDVALGIAVPAETRIEGASATRQTVRERTSGADVVCFWTHGSHDGDGGPSIALADGPLELPLPAEDWAGAERVELWACETGVGLPADRLTPPGVDEPFGMDFEFLRLGVRSAIGTLWSVPEIVTAVIARRFRQRLAAGVDAARALADAQRWWLAEGMPTLFGLLDGRSVDQAAREFARNLGAQAENGGFASLGPAPDPDAPMSADEIAFWRDYLACPVAWGGLRFVGVPERRPLRPWTEEHARPPTEEERQQVRDLIDSPPVRERATDAWERAVADLDESVPGSPTPAQAITAARLYRDRVASSHRHNLLAGLAWLHEALAAGDLAAEDRALLSIEAAHLWLDLAAGEAMHPLLSPVDPGALDRARRLLDGLAAEGRDPTAARARRAYLEAVRGPAGDMDEAARQAWKIMAPLVDGAVGPNLADVRFATIACELFMPRPSSMADQAKEALVLADRTLAVLPRTLADPLLVPPVVRLVAARAALSFAIDPEAGTLGERFEVLTPRELGRAAVRHLRGAMEEGPAGTERFLSIMSEALGQMEGALWGWPSNRRPLAASSGTAGRAYRDLAAQYLAGKTVMSTDASHFIACLQYACDVRLAFLHNVMRMAACVEKLGSVISRDLARPLRHRDGLLETLADITRLAPGMSALDPFTQPASEIAERTRSSSDATAWVLAKLCGWRADAEPVTRTAAYQAVRMAGRRAAWGTRAWERFQEADEEAQERVAGTSFRPAKVVDPGIVLEENHEILRGLPEGRGILALTLDHTMGLIGAALWRDAHGPGQRVIHVTEAALPDLLLDVLLPRPVDDSAPRGRCAGRRAAWARLDRWLAPRLRDLLGAAAPNLHWSVFTPGALRPLPVLGLHAGDDRIAARVGSLIHLPAIGFSKVPGSGLEPTRSACLLAREREDGDTTFGEAVIETLRRAFPPDVVVDPGELRGRTIVEVDTLEAVDRTLGSLRLYGVGASETINATTAGLRLDGRRALGSHNLASLELGGCESVEIWACVAAGADVPVVLGNDSDRVPGLAASFLSVGARGVLDLAWPVPDLVKAVVCEQFTFARTRTRWGPTALRYAVFASAGLLGEWANKARGAASIDEALAVLDSMRRFVAPNIHGIDPACIVPFAGRANAPSLAGLSLPEVFQEVTDPSHLGAFRWWGL